MPQPALQRAINLRASGFAGDFATGKPHHRTRLEFLHVQKLIVFITSGLAAKPSGPINEDKNKPVATAPVHVHRRALHPTAPTD
jgi:hypothetical protein